MSCLWMGVYKWLIMWYQVWIKCKK